MPGSLAEAVAGAPSGVAWSACVRDLATGEVVAAASPDAILPAASMGKLLLLIEVARQVEAGELAPGERLARQPGDAVADSGLWRHLDAGELCVADLATLVGAVSDNLATNVLLRRVGLGPVQAAARRLGLRATTLHDRVRDERTAADPPALSSATAAELSWLFAELDAGRVVSPGVSEQVLGWLAHGADLSMVASAFGLDPLARGADGLRHKTGTDAGVRADAGLLTGPGGGVAYAVLARWIEGDRRDAVLAAMRAVGEALRAGVG
jgi:beta-lactamase class A